MHAASVALVVAGTIVVVAAALAALAARGAYHRLHLLTPITSLGGPLIALGLAIRDGAGLTTASILFPVGLLFLASPVTSAATARMLAQREGRIRPGGPE